MLTRLSTKGHLIIPKEIRERHGWRPGSQIEVEDRRDAVVLRAARGVPRATLEDLVGCTGYEGSGRSLEEMEEAIVRRSDGNRTPPRRSCCQPENVPEDAPRDDSQS